MNFHFVEAIAQAKHQEFIEEARIERIVKNIPNARPSATAHFIRPIHQIVRQVSRAIIKIGAELEEKQRPIL